MPSYIPATGSNAPLGASPLIVSTALPAIEDLNKKRKHYDDLNRGMQMQVARRNQQPPKIYDGEEPPRPMNKPYG